MKPEEEEECLRLLNGLNSVYQENLARQKHAMRVMSMEQNKREMGELTNKLNIAMHELLLFHRRTCNLTEIAVESIDEHSFYYDIEASNLLIDFLHYVAYVEKDFRDIFDLVEVNKIVVAENKKKFVAAFFLLVKEEAWLPKRLGQTTEEIIFKRILYNFRHMHIFHRSNIQGLSNNEILLYKLHYFNKMEWFSVYTITLVELLKREHATEESFLPTLLRAINFPENPDSECSHRLKAGASM